MLFDELDLFDTESDDDGSVFRSPGMRYFTFSLKNLLVVLVIRWYCLWRRVSRLLFNRSRCRRSSVERKCDDGRRDRG